MSDRIHQDIEEKLPNGWNEWSRYVVVTIKQHGKDISNINDCLHDLEIKVLDKIAEAKEAMTKELSKTKEDLAKELSKTKEDLTKEIGKAKEGFYESLTKEKDRAIAIEHDHAISLKALYIRAGIVGLLGGLIPVLTLVLISLFLKK